ncbi:MAG TPA: sarcosine oxidase subunit delta [Acetobacteraceae bacterium]|nr:sarcosine oxidase subunit delta [Acetobacteraceae bacterium]
MLLIDCPYCGKRPELEFTYGGEAHLARRPSSDDAGWADFLYARTNPKGLHAERWRHTHGCARFFNALRDTVSDFFVATYRIGEQRPDQAPAPAEKGREAA